MRASTLSASLARRLFSPLLGFLEQDEIVGYYVTDVQVDDPVHQIEADKADRKDDARVLVDIRRRYAWKIESVFVDIVRLFAVYKCIVLVLCGKVLKKGIPRIRT